MPFRNSPQYLADILNSIRLIEEFVGTMTYDEYKSDRKTQAAVERELQIVTEAATRLGDEAETLCPGPPWPKIRGLGNVIRHAYDYIVQTEVWHTVQSDVPPLKAAVESSLAAIAEKSPTDPTP